MYFFKNYINVKANLRTFSKRNFRRCPFSVVMVKNNLKIGYWDGELVKECRPVVYHYYPSRSNEKVNKDINFSDYSKVVDEFFRKLKL